MSEMNRESQSIWMKSTPTLTVEKLPDQVHTDICVIGAGIAGLTTALLLARAGRKVIVVEKETIGGGETGRTTAHLSNAIDSRFYEIERMHGQAGAKLTAESHSAAIDTIEEICGTEKIECDFKRVNGYLFSPRGKTEQVLEKEWEAAQRAGLVETVLEKEIPIPSLTDKPCLIFPNQAQFSPLKYLNGVAAALRKLGGEIFIKTKVSKVAGGKQTKVSMEGGAEINCKFIVVATNSPINDRLIMHTKQAAYRTYAIAFPIARNSVPTGLYWDTLDPYHYIRIQDQGEQSFLIVGGEDHRTGQAPKDPQAEEACYQRLENWAQQHFKNITPSAFRWSGQVEETIDGLAFIGRNPLDAENIFIATGDCGMGLTHGTIAGLLLRDLILGKNNPWEKLYSPSRKSLSAFKNFAMENANTALQYRDLVTNGDLTSVDDLQRGTGGIIRHRLGKVAAFRSEAGKLHTVSALCPHLGGVVRWNAAEKTWDCPCHGSRFSAEGKVLHGPCISDLPAVDLANH